MPHLVAPSILSADFSKLGEAIELINRSSADWVHCDVMDGNFVPNISFGLPVLDSVKKISKKPLDVHLMISNPDTYIEDFKKAGAEILTVHYEACRHLHRTVQTIRELGMRPGVALNPHTPVHHLESIIGDLDLVLIMSVNPAFGGQKFIPETIQKIGDMKAMINDAGATTMIEVDGGINAETAARVLKAGADVLVAGSAVFNSPDPSASIQELKDIRLDTIRA